MKLTSVVLLSSTVLAACSTVVYKADPSTLPEMSRLEARKALSNASAGTLGGCPGMSRTWIDPTDATNRISLVPTADAIEVTCDNGKCRFPYARNSAVEVKQSGAFITVELTADSCGTFPLDSYNPMRFEKQEEAVRFAKAVGALAGPQPSKESALAVFAPVTKQKQIATASELPEAARRFSVQAEDLVKQKNFLDAAIAFEEALEIAPTWTQGHFNLALLLGELELYPEAVIEMRKYLLLVPGAPNARAAQDKTYVWEGKAKRE